MARKPAKAEIVQDRPLQIFEGVLLALCLCLLALRVTYTESPIAQMLTTMPGSLTDTIYSLTISGLLIFAFGLWLVVRVCSRRFTYHVIGIEFGLILFGLAAVLAGLGASDKRVAITQTMVLIGPIFAALLLAQILRTNSQMRLVLVVVVALGVVTACQCAEQFLSSNKIMIEQYEKDPNSLLAPLGIEPGTFQQFLFEHRLYSRGIRGFFTTSNSAASFGILASFAALVLLIRNCTADRTRSELPPYLLPGLTSLMVIAGLLLTQSKGGILAFIAGVVLFAGLLALRRRIAAHRRLAAMILVLAPLLLVAVGGCVAASYGLRHGSLPGGNSMLVRWQYWAASARMYADHWLIGIGPGNFSNYYPHYKPASALESVSDPHNVLLSLATQYGPLGLLGFLVMVLVPLWRSVASLEVQPSDEARSPSAFRKPAVIMLAVVCAFLLILRPMLIPLSSTAGTAVLLYELATLYVAPVAAFFIGYLLAAAPMQGTLSVRPSIRRTVLVAAMVSSILAVLLHNLIDFALFEPGVWTAFWIAMACLVDGSRPRPDKSAAHKLALAWRLVAVAVVLVLLVAYNLFVWRPVWLATARIQKAQGEVTVGLFDQAHDDLAAAFDADPLSTTALDLDGRLYAQQYAQLGRGQPRLLDKAAQCFRKAVAVNPADYKDYEKLAQVYVELQRWQDAYNWYLKAAELYPGCERLWFRLAQSAEQLGKTNGALTYYTKAVQIEESYEQQFRRMYPQREKVISRLGDADLLAARTRIAELSRPTDQN
jgi:O-antigen ligase